MTGLVHWALHRSDVRPDYPGLAENPLAYIVCDGEQVVSSHLSWQAAREHAVALNMKGGV